MANHDGVRYKPLPTPPKGGFRKQRKLTEYDVVQIFGALRCGVPTALIGYEFGVRQETVLQIRRGATWKDLPRPQFPSTKKHLHDFHVEQVIDMLANGASVREAAAHVGTTTTTIYRELRRLRREQGIPDEWVPGSRQEQAHRNRGDGAESAHRPGTAGAGAGDGDDRSS